jgi:hypothetical protein
MATKKQHEGKGLLSGTTLAGAAAGALLGGPIGALLGGVVGSLAGSRGEGHRPNVHREAEWRGEAELTDEAVGAEDRAAYEAERPAEALRVARQIAAPLQDDQPVQAGDYIEKTMRLLASFDTEGVKAKGREGAAVRALSDLDALLSTGIEANARAADTPDHRLPEAGHLGDPCDYAGWTFPSDEDLMLLAALRKKNPARYKFTADDVALVKRLNVYTKRTVLYGNFSVPEKRRIEPVNTSKQGSWLQSLGGKSARTKELRSVTPAGFARAFYEANKDRVYVEEAG